MAAARSGAQVQAQTVKITSVSARVCGVSAMLELGGGRARQLRQLFGAVTGGGTAAQAVRALASVRVRSGFGIEAVFNLVGGAAGGLGFDPVKRGSRTLLEARAEGEGRAEVVGGGVGGDRSCGCGGEEEPAGESEEAGEEGHVCAAVFAVVTRWHIFRFTKDNTLSFRAKAWRPLFKKP